MKIRDLKAIAREVLKKYWDGTLPVSPAEIARRMGVRVEASPDMGEVSGQFSLTSDGPLIRYNCNEPYVRQRFTIAHEIGHYILQHGPAFRDPAKNFSEFSHDQKEVSANRFAAEILMPDVAVAAYIREKRIYQLSELARRFAVSDAAIKYRLKNLGWIS